MSATDATVAGLCAFVDASPSPFHVCATVAADLAAREFVELRERDVWPDGPGRYYVIRGGSLIAWVVPSESVGGFRGERSDGGGFRGERSDGGVFRGERSDGGGFRIVAGHTDSPNLRVKQYPDLTSAGWQLVGLEPYGGAWTNSWLDRDLGLSGRVAVRDSSAARTELLLVNEPILRVPQLAIHLADDRKGVHLDPQRHVNAVWGVNGAPRSFHEFVGERLGVSGGDVLGWELMTHDLAPSQVVGVAGELLSAPRLDNQGTCYAGTKALIAATATELTHVPVLALFDHEEVGSMSDRGAQSELLITTLERIVIAGGGDRQDFLRACAGSIVASGDMAHATHPNYPERHEPAHRIAVNAGPVLKVNQNLRYATDSVGAAAFELACEQAGVPLQRYVHRADLPCGSTIGPFTAARTGMSTVDVGAAQLAMHSARELMGANDVRAYADALAAFLGASRS